MATQSEPRALTRAWFHGWCQCGSTELQLVDTWPQSPYTICADCGYIASHVSATYYALTDTENGRRYLSYRSMRWPFYLPTNVGTHSTAWETGAQILAFYAAHEASS